MTQQPFDFQRALLQQLETLRRAGLRDLPHIDLPQFDTSAESTPEPPAAAEVSPGTVDDVEGNDADRKEITMPRTNSPADNAAADAPTAGDPAAELNVLEQEVAGCTLCSELAATRTQTVFGVGNPNARVLFFGEAPGADEDRQGEPFVGRAGQLLTKIIAACTWKREDVYILNTLKCRPPGNRNPDAEELSNCRPYWKRQLEIIQPEYIVCVGKFAMQELLNTPPSQAIGRMRRKFHDYDDGNVAAKVVVTYHPSYLLRNPAAKKDVWDDMKMLMRDMGIEVP